MADEHYFTADPQAAFKRIPVSANVWGHWLELTSGSGVFSQGRLDLGTGVLLREQAAPEGARTVLDLGCGYGVIGLAIAVTVQPGTATAMASPITPYPQPRSSTECAPSGAGCSRRSTPVPMSRRPCAKTPDPDVSSSQWPQTFALTGIRLNAACGSAVK